MNQFINPFTKLFVKQVIIVFCISMLGACGYIPPSPDPEFSSVRPVSSKPLPINDGAIYKAGYDILLFEDLKARRVGDIITVILSEQTNASKRASTSTAKESTVDFSAPTLLGRGVTRNGAAILENALDANRGFSGEADSTQSNSLSGNIAVTIVEVFSNGNLMIRGEKLLTLNQGSERIQFSGIIRAADVSTDNTVLSTQVANARIKYAGEGVLADANNPGWLTRFFNSGLWPF